MKMFAIVVALGTALPTLAQVSVTAPANNSQVATTVQYVATATTPCAKGVSAIGMTCPNVLAYVVAGSKLNTELNLNPGTYQTVVQEWDNCGGVGKANVTITVKGTAAEVQVHTPSNISSSQRKSNIPPRQARHAQAALQRWASILDLECSRT